MNTSFPSILPTPAGQHRWLSALILVLALALALPLSEASRTPMLPSLLSSQSFATLPLSFVPNAGQNEPAVQMQASGLGGAIAFAPTYITFALPVDQAGASTSLRLTWAGANLQPAITGVDRLLGVYHFYVGQPEAWRSNIPTYAAVLYHGLYPGIDLRYDGQDGLLKGTYLVAPGVNPALIRWQYQGAQAVALDSTTGNLQIHLGDGSVLVEERPIAWQDGAAGRTPVSASFVVQDETIHFALGSYDPQLPLVIDPAIHYSTFLGGNSSDFGNAIAVDTDGNIVVTGQTYSSNFPGAGTSIRGSTDLFISKLNAQGTALLYTTILGGGGDEVSHGLALDQTGNAWLTGETESQDFPANALGNTYGGNGDTFVAKLAATGTLLRSGYLGSSVHDLGYAIALDAQGDAYVAGEVAATYGPESFVRKIKADMSENLYSAYFGSAKRGFDKGTSVRAIAVDQQGNAYVTGRTNAILSDTDDGGFQPFCTQYDGVDCTFDDALIVKLNAAGNAIPFFTYLGGHGNDIGTAIAIDPQGNILVTGYTFAADFPTKDAMQPAKRGLDNFTDAFVTKLTPQGDALVYSTYLGGDAWEEGHSLAVDGAGNAYVVGMTNSPDNFPISADAPQPTLRGICSGGSASRTCYDGFATKLTAAGALMWSTFLGGTDDDQANGVVVDGNGNVYVVGSTESSGFPTTTGVVQANKSLSDDAFVLKIVPESQATPTPTATTAPATPTVIVTPATPTAPPSTPSPGATLQQVYLPVVQK